MIVDNFEIKPSTSSVDETSGSAGADVEFSSEKYGGRCTESRSGTERVRTEHRANPSRTNPSRRTQLLSTTQSRNRRRTNASTVLHTSNVLLLIFAVFVSLLPASDAQSLTESQIFTAQPKSSQYFVSVGSGELLLPCAFNTSLLAQPGYTRQWVKTIDQRPRQITDDESLLQSGYYALEASAATGAYNLRVLNVSYDRDNALFFCQLRTPQGTYHDVQAHVTVLVRPSSLRIDGLSEQPVSEGALLYPECISEGGNPSPTLTWKYEDGRPVPSNWTTTREIRQDVGFTVRNSLRLSVLADYNNQYFTCEAFNEAMKADNQPMLQQTGKLQVLYKPRVTVGPAASYVVEAGDQAELVCEAEGNPDNLQYRWSHTAARSGLSAGARPRVSFRATKESQGNYTCEVSNSEGTGRASLSLFVSYGPTIHLPSESLTVREEGTLTLQCNVDAYPAAELIEWTAPQGQKYNGSTWLIDNVTRQQRGNYTCSAENVISVYGRQPERRRNSGTVQVMVTYPPGQARLVVQPSTVTVGDNVTLVCECDDPGYPAASYVFKYNGRDLASSPESTFSIPLISVEKAGEYSCQPVNAYGHGGTATQMIRVYQPATLLSYLDTETGPYDEGNKGVTLACRANGNPKPAFEWFKDGRRLVEDGRFKIESFESEQCSDPLRCLYDTTSTVRWTTGVNWQDHGIYRCIASNGIGVTDESSGILRVTHKPHVINTEGQSIYAADIGSQGRLRCIVTSLPRAEFRWYKSNKEEIIPAQNNKYAVDVNYNAQDDITTGTLTIAGVQAADYGDYTCEPRNVEGTGDTHSIALREKSRPTVPRELRVLDQTHSSLLVSWEPGFDGGHLQQFVLNVFEHDPVTGAVASVPKVEELIPDQDLTSFGGVGGGVGRRTARYLSRSFSPVKQFNVTGLYSATAYTLSLMAKNTEGTSGTTRLEAVRTEQIPADTNIEPPAEAKYVANNQRVTYKATPNNLPLCVMIYIERDSQLYRYDCAPATSTTEGMSTIANLPQVAGLRVAFCERQARPIACSQIVKAESVAATSSALLDVLVPIVIVAAALLALAAVVLICCCMNRCGGAPSKQRRTHDQYQPDRRGPKTISHPFPSGTMEAGDKATDQRSDSGMFTMQSHHPNFDPAVNGGGGGGGYTNNGMRSFDDPDGGQGGGGDGGTLDWSPSMTNDGTLHLHDMPYSSDMQGGGIQYYDEYGQPVDVHNSQQPHPVVHDDDRSSSYSQAAGGRRVMQEIVV